MIQPCNQCLSIAIESVHELKITNITHGLEPCQVQATNETRQREGRQKASSSMFSMPRRRSPLSLPPSLMCKQKVVEVKPLSQDPDTDAIWECGDSHRCLALNAFYVRFLPCLSKCLIPGHWLGQQLRDMPGQAWLISNHLKLSQQQTFQLSSNLPEWRGRMQRDARPNIMADLDISRSRQAFLSDRLFLLPM